MNVPSDAELWYDPADMPILREDAKDAAEIEETKQRTIVGYVKDGFTPESAVAAVQGQNVTLLQHSGLVSVQLQPPGGPAGREPDVQQARDLVEMVQKIYLGVGTVLTYDEARNMLNQAGAELPLGQQPQGNGKAPAAVGS